MMGTLVHVQLYTFSYRKPVIRPQNMPKTADWGQKRSKLWYFKMGPQVQPKCFQHVQRMINQRQLKKRSCLIRFGLTEALLSIQVSQKLENIYYNPLFLCVNMLQNENKPKKAMIMIISIRATMICDFLTHTKMLNLSCMNHYFPTLVQIPSKNQQTSNSSAPIINFVI